MARNSTVLRVYRMLSATKRARAFVKRFKSGREPDDLLVRTMPGEQVRAFNHAIDLLMATHALIPTRTQQLLVSLDGLRQRKVQLNILRMWGADLDVIEL